MIYAVEWRHVSAFDIFLRTGRRIDEGLGPGWSTKFNHNQDPRNGRFTFASVGMSRRPRDPFRGGGGSSGGGGATGTFFGGGSFGGGGASGNWDAPDRRSPTEKRRRPVVAAAPVHGRVRRPGRTVTRNGYNYRIDAEGRTTGVSGKLTMATRTKRSRSEQRRAGGSDRLPTDDGGHYIAARFNGLTDAFNHFAQDANFNRGVYRRLEDQWAEAARRGKNVLVSISPHYSGASKRPDKLMIQWTFGGHSRRQLFYNRPKGQ